MSNKAVPQTYRAIIDRVINSVRPDFEENGIEEAVLLALQESWEAKLAMSRVTDFSSDPRLGAYQGMLPSIDPKEKVSGNVTSNGVDKGLNGSSKSQIDQDRKPSLPISSRQISLEASTSSTSVPSTTSLSTSDKKSPSGNTIADADALNSDLDESDEDLLSDDEANDDDHPSGLGAGQEGDVIIALYEKVVRVKNKWKITLKDGVISAEGKDWVFSKCQGDFEW